LIKNVQHAQIIHAARKEFRRSKASIYEFVDDIDYFTKPFSKVSRFALMLST